MFVIFFFFKQKTAYEMRISDWSSDVCSSDLAIPLDHNEQAENQFFDSESPISITRYLRQRKTVQPGFLRARRKRNATGLGCTIRLTSHPIVGISLAITTDAVPLDVIDQVVVRLLCMTGIRAAAAIELSDRKSGA